MARPKEFDRDSALELAMMVFWEKGFEATSVQDLVERMGINRGSLYDTFGDKHSLYLEALRYYERSRGSEGVKLLDSEPSGRRAIEQFFDEVVDRCFGERGGCGCFLANTIVERAQHCAKTSEHCCKRARDDSEITSSVRPREMARFFVNSFVGILVLAKASPERRLLKDITRVTLSVLD